MFEIIWFFNIINHNSRKNNFSNFTHVLKLIPTLKFPNETKLPNSIISTRFVFIGYDAFSLRNYLMLPFPRKQSQENDKAYYNYIGFLVLECTFSSMSLKFCILLKSIETTEKINTVL